MDICIDSILKQTYDYFELILVDDGSTDSSGKICDKYSRLDDRVIVVHNENLGVSSARNAGLDVATGNYICYVDGDDYVSNDYLEYMLELLIKNEADISLTRCMSGNFDSNKCQDDSIVAWNNEDAIEAILCYNVPIGCYCKLFKRDTVKNIKFLDNVFIGEGFNYNIACFQVANKIITGSKKIYYYRRDNSTSAMTKFKVDKVECGLKALKIIKNKLTITDNRIIEAWEFANWRTYSDFYDFIVLGNAKKSYPEMYKMLKKYTKKYAFSALKVPTSSKNRLRAIIMKFWPSLIPKLLLLRRKKYKVKFNQ